MYYSNMHDYRQRTVYQIVNSRLKSMRAVCLLGPRQVGKTTIAKKLMEEDGNSVYLDLESPRDRQKLQDPETYFDYHKDKLVILDEVQRIPELFAIMRSSIDSFSKPGRFLVLGSASGDLLKQTSESLAGRIAYVELSPLSIQEFSDLPSLWLRGGFPLSTLAGSDSDSMSWRQDFLRTFLERDIPQLGIRIPSPQIRRFWSVCAHLQGQQLNMSEIGKSIGFSYQTVKNYIDLLEQTFMLRVLPPFHKNVKKRLVKSPRLYVRDSGLLHSLLDIRTRDDVFGHPIYGASWEGFVIETIINALPEGLFSYYRTSNQAEMDLVIEIGNQTICVETKASSAPTVSKGFWTSIQDIQPDQVWVVAPVTSAYPMKQGVMVSNLDQFLTHLLDIAPS